MKTVLVGLTTSYNKNGTPHLVKCKPKVYNVTAVYESGKVRTNSGDVWEVIPNPKKHESDFIAVS